MPKSSSSTSSSLVVASNNDVDGSDKPQVWGNDNQQQQSMNGVQKSINSTISFSCSVEDVGEPARPYEFLGHKAEVVYSLLTMLSAHDRLESSQTFLAISQELESSQLMRQSGCMPLLIQLLHNGDITSSAQGGEDLEVANRASQALRNLVRLQTDEQRQRRELKILRPLEQIRAYVLRLRVERVGANNSSSKSHSSAMPQAQDIAPAMAILMKFSFDEEDRHVTFQLGGVQAIAETLIIDQFAFGNDCSSTRLNLRRYIGMTLTNLTFGAAENKQILCSYPKFLETLNSQIQSPMEDIRSVFASVLRNLSWKADISSKMALSNVSTCTVLTKAAMRAEKENTLKSILSALWNLSAHCSENKVEICNVRGGLEFLVATLSYDCVSSSQGTAIVENDSGILRNISSHVAAREEYREILRRNNCFQILLRHLQSSSLTIVSNACGTLWNLSAHNQRDQKLLWEMGAVPMLANLVHSKHKMISLGSSATLKNLLDGKLPPSQPPICEMSCLYPKGEFFGSNSSAVLLKARKYQYRTLECEIDENLSGVCCNFTKSSHVVPANQLSEIKCFTPHMQNYNITKNSSSLTNFLTNNGPPLDQIKSSAVLSCSASSSMIAMQRSKIEQLQQDQWITQRFHNSLRRCQRKETARQIYQDRDNNDEEVVWSYCVKENDITATASTSRGNGRFLEPLSCALMPAPCSRGEENVKSYAVEGTPSAQLSLGSSLSDLRNALDKDDATLFVKCQSSDVITLTSDSNRQLGGSQQHSKVSTAAMPTPLMYSRHSSLQSLESCEQQSIRSTVYSDYSQLATGLHSPSELPDSPTQTVPPTPCSDKSGIRQDPLGTESAARVDSKIVIKSALPKLKFKASNQKSPKRLRNRNQSVDDNLKNYVLSQHAGKNVAIAKPMLRETTTVESVPASSSYFKTPLGVTATAIAVRDEEQNDVRVYATEPTPGTLRSLFNNLYIKSPFNKDDELPANNGSRKMRGSPCTSLTKQSPAVQSPKSFEYSEITVLDTGLQKRERTNVEQCIYSALPRPKNYKSKSLDRKSCQQPLTTACKTSSKNSVQQPAIDFLKLQQVTTTWNTEKGILETSEISLVDSVSDEFGPSGSSANTTKHDADLMEASLCSNNLVVRVASTCEKVKDAASLFTDTVDQPLSDIFCCPPSPLQVHAGTTTAEQRSSDETNESLSEDNYSTIEDKDDLIDIDLLFSASDDSPLNDTVIHCTEKIDNSEGKLHNIVYSVNNVSEDTNMLVSCNASSGDLLSPKTVTNNDQDEDENPSVKMHGPKIVKHLPTQEVKKICGMKKGHLTKLPTPAALAAPKLAVRTTKTTELRAKRVNDNAEQQRFRTFSGDNGSHSASPAKPRKLASSPRLSDAELTDIGRFPRNSCECKSRQSTSSGKVYCGNSLCSGTGGSNTNVLSWPRSLGNFNNSSNKSSERTRPFLHIDALSKSKLNCHCK